MPPCASPVFCRALPALIVALSFAVCAAKNAARPPDIIL
jgi:hypothetical protein